MHPYRDGERREDRDGRAGDLALAVAILLVGALLLAIGVATGRPTEAGLGAGALLFGVYAFVTRG